MKWQQTKRVDAVHFFQSDDKRAPDGLEFREIDGLKRVFGVNELPLAPTSK